MHKPNILDTTLVAFLIFVMPAIGLGLLLFKQIMGDDIDFLFVTINTPLLTAICSGIFFIPPIIGAMLIRKTGDQSLINKVARPVIIMLIAFPVGIASLLFSAAALIAGTAHFAASNNPGHPAASAFGFAMFIVSLGCFAAFIIGYISAFINFRKFVHNARKSLKK